MLHHFHVLHIVLASNLLHMSRLLIMPIIVILILQFLFNLRPYNTVLWTLYGHYSFDTLYDYGYTIKVTVAIFVCTYACIRKAHELLPLLISNKIDALHVLRVIDVNLVGPYLAFNEIDNGFASQGLSVSSHHARVVTT